MQRHTVTHVSTETTDLGLAQRGHSSMPKAMPVYRSTRTVARTVGQVSVLDTLKAEAREAVRETRDDIPKGLLTPAEHDLLQQFSDGKYLTGVFRFAEVGQKCRTVGGATALAERLRGFTVQHHPNAHVCYLDAFGTESEANGEFDVAQINFAANPTESNRQRAIAAGNRQLAETHRALNALHRAAR